MAELSTLGAAIRAGLMALAGADRLPASAIRDLPPSSVQSVNGQTGDVVIDIEDLGGAPASALAGVLARANHTGEQAISTVTGLQGALNAKEAVSVYSANANAAATLLPADDRARIRFTHATPVLSIALQSAQAYPDGFVMWGRAPAGLVIDAPAGATLNGTDGLNVTIGASTSGAGFKLSRDGVNAWTVETTVPSAHTHTASQVTDFAAATDAAIDEAFGGAVDGVAFWSAGVKSTLSGLSLAPATIYDVLSGQANGTPSADLALHRWNTHRRVGAIVSGVAQFDWPGPGVGEADRSSSVAYDITGSVGMAVSTITDANLLAQNPRRYTIELTFNNILAPSATLSLAAAAAGRMPIRYSSGVVDLQVPYGQSAVAMLTVYPTFVVVRSLQLIGKPVPGLITQLLTGAAPSQPQISSFSPDLVDDAPVSDRVLVAMVRIDGTSVTAPSDKGYTALLGNGLDPATGLIMTDTGFGARMYVATPVADGPFGGTGSFTSWDLVVAAATRGGVLHTHGAMCGISASMGFSSFTGIPEGSLIYGLTARQLSTPAKPPDATVLTRSDGSPSEGLFVSSAWQYSWWRAAPVAGAWAPASISQTSCRWFSLAFVVAPN